MTPALSSCQVRCSFSYIQPLATSDTTDTYSSAYNAKYELSETVNIVQEVTGEVLRCVTSLQSRMFCYVLFSAGKQIQWNCGKMLGQEVHVARLLLLYTDFGTYEHCVLQKCSDLCAEVNWHWAFIG